jgi:arylsulfatase A-like enzyme
VKGMKDHYPNIILIVLDATRQDHLSCYGYPKNTTPNIDEFSKDSVTYKNAFSVSPWTLPSFASIFTGLYPSQHGVDRSTPLLDGEYTTISEYLRNLGYETLFITNNSWLNEHSKFNRGFDSFLKVWQFYQVNEDPVGRRGLQKDKFTLKNAIYDIKQGNTLKNLVNAIYGKFFYKRSDFGARKVNSLFKKWYTTKHRKKPFFACLHYLEPHLEYIPRKEFAEKFLPDGVGHKGAMKINQDAWSYICGENKFSERELEILNALYDAELNYLDYRIGELIGFLKEVGVYADTSIIITADHGENVGEHDLMDHQYCL